MQKNHRHIGQRSNPKRGRIGACERLYPHRAHVTAFLDGNAVKDRPGEKRREQQHATRVAIGQKMCQRPDRSRPAWDGAASP